MTTLRFNQGASGPHFVAENDPRTLPLSRQQRALLDSKAARVLLRAGNLTGLTFALSVACARAALEGKDALFLLSSWSMLDEARRRMVARGWVVENHGRTVLRGPGGGSVSFQRREGFSSGPDQYDLVAVRFLPTEYEWGKISWSLRPGGRVLVATTTNFLEACPSGVQAARQRVAAGELEDLHFPLTQEALVREGGLPLSGKHLGQSADAWLQEPGAAFAYRAEWPDQVSA